MIFGCDKIGKEDILVQIAKHFKERIYVPESMLRLYRLLKLPDVFSTDDSECRLWVMPRNQINKQYLSLRIIETPTVAIVLTASESLASGPRYSDKEAILVVAHSNHSSPSELAKFLHFLRPREVRRIVDRDPGNDVGSSVIDDYIKMRNEETGLIGDWNLTMDDDPDEEILHDEPGIELKRWSRADGEQNGEEGKVGRWRRIFSLVEEAIGSIHGKLDTGGDAAVHSDEVLSNLRDLIKLYEPITGFGLDDSGL